MRGYLGNQARNRPGNKGSGGGGGGRPNRGGNNDGNRGERGNNRPQQHDELPQDDPFDSDDVGIISPSELAASRVK